MSCTEPYTIEFLAQKLAAYEKQYLTGYKLKDPSQNLTEAAVLVPLTCTEEGWQLVFIRRSDGPNDTHRGQVAFPGGKREPTDRDLTQTVLREAHEEIGLSPHDVKLIGKLPTRNTSTGYLVTPFVAVIPPGYTFILDYTEVSRVFTIPLGWLEETAHREEKDFLGSDKVMRYGVIYYQPYDGEVLWGASARMVQDFIKIIES